MSQPPKNGTPNTFVLFKNDFHKEGSNRPVYSGYYYDPNGVPHKMDGWVKKKSDGALFISGVCVDNDTYERNKAKFKEKNNPQIDPEYKEGNDDLPF